MWCIFMIDSIIWIKYQPLFWIELFFLRGNCEYFFGKFFCRILCAINKWTPYSVFLLIPHQFEVRILSFSNKSFIFFSRTYTMFFSFYVIGNRFIYSLIYLTFIKENASESISERYTLKNEGTFFLYLMHNLVINYLNYKEGFSTKE